MAPCDVETTADFSLLFDDINFTSVSKTRAIHGVSKSSFFPDYTP